jgi:hypothetical protein
MVKGVPLGWNAWAADGFELMPVFGHDLNIKEQQSDEKQHCK